MLFIMSKASQLLTNAKPKRPHVLIYPVIMETINTVELRDASKYPDEELLKSILGKSFSAYKKLLTLFNKHGLLHEWRYYKDGKAWLCKVQFKKRTIVWMSVWKDYTQSAIYFPEKYINTIYDLDISQATKDGFTSTKNVGKSKPFISKITEERILQEFEKVMLHKIACK